MTVEETHAAQTPAGDCWFLSGATASGKTAVAVELALRLGAEIISLDSMAVYRGMDIGTAKPTPAERGGIPHHLIDIVEPADAFSLAEYVAAAEAAAADIRSRGREPLFVGGTPLYLKALLRGIFTAPPADWPLRQEWHEAAKERGREWLHAELARIDPAAAAALHPANTRRIIRALEVFQKTGVPISELQRQFARARPAEACRVFVLDWPRAELNGRIERRVEAMFAAGLVDEVRSLTENGRALGRTAGQAVGYREAIEHLAGVRDLAATIELVKTRTRQFAKRQGVWFRGLSECRFVPIGKEFDPRDVAERIMRTSEVALPSPPVG